MSLALCSESDRVATESGRGRLNHDAHSPHHSRARSLARLTFPVALQFSPSFVESELLSIKRQCCLHATDQELCQLYVRRAAKFDRELLYMTSALRTEGGMRCQKCTTFALMLSTVRFGLPSVWRPQCVQSSV